MAAGRAAGTWASLMAPPEGARRRRGCWRTRVSWRAREQKEAVPGWLGVAREREQGERHPGRAAQERGVGDPLRRLAVGGVIERVAGHPPALSSHRQTSLEPGERRLAEGPVAGRLVQPIQHMGHAEGAVAEPGVEELARFGVARPGPLREFDGFALE